MIWLVAVIIKLLRNCNKATKISVGNGFGVAEILTVVEKQCVKIEGSHRQCIW
jgi:hypothetical protein